MLDQIINTHAIFTLLVKNIWKLFNGFTSQILKSKWYLMTFYCLSLKYSLNSSHFHFLVIIHRLVRQALCYTCFKHVGLNSGIFLFSREAWKWSKYTLAASMWTWTSKCMLRFKTSETIKTNILFCAMKIKLSLYFSGLNTSHRRICRVCLKSLENSNRWIGLKENLSGEIIFF